MRAAILFLAFLFPGVVSAQDSVSTTAPTPDVAATESPSSEDPQAPRAGAAQPPRTGTTQPPPAQRRRRGSMVGYIVDSTIGSYVRVRFDAGWDNTAPDRAEFFYAQCGCNDATAPGPGEPGAQDLATSVNYQHFIADVQYAVHPRIAVFGSVPLRSVQPQSFLGESLNPPQLGNTFESGSGFSDLRAGVKGSVFETDDVLLTAMVQGYFPSGDAKEGLGTDHASFEAALLFQQSVSDRVNIEAQFGNWSPIGGSTAGGTDYAGNVLFYGIGSSYALVDTGRLTFAPVVELVGWRVLGGLVQNAGSLEDAGANIVNLKIGGRANLDDQSSFYVGYGFAMTDAQWYDKILRLEYRYSF
jgi:hypothetical protein